VSSRTKCSASWRDGSTERQAGNIAGGVESDSEPASPIRLWRFGKERIFAFYRQGKQSKSAVTMMGWPSGAEPFNLI
jgi:hypothetical protein